LGTLVDWLTEPEFRCDHALSFGFGYLCRHPDREQIAAHCAARQPEQ
jgi:hypothetical protein